MRSMSGEERRSEIIKYIIQNKKPASGTALAAKFEVSRQVIVQDIALLRAEGYQIISTNRGYICYATEEVSRVFYVVHDDEKIQEELNLIVDLGGTIQDVFVKHDIYGELRANLMIDSRRKVKTFMEGLVSGTSSPLNKVTSGYHYHTVTAESEEILDGIEEELRKNHFLIEVV